jgi:hypothetical protein
MKKFFFTLFILLLIGGAAFLLGWAQFTVPPGSYGVIISKTYGVDPSPVRSGEFRWIWFKLIPTNVQIAVFRLEPEKFTINFNSSLPAGDSYASFAGLGVDFSWELRAAMAFSLDPESLVPVVEKHNITSQDELNEYLSDVAKGIELIVMRTFSSESMDSDRLEKILAGGQDAQMEREILKKYPEIRDFSFSVQSARFPDFVLYRQVRLLYEEFLAKQREVIAGAFGQRAQSHIAARLHFDELERYGELLSKYPVLLEYLALEKNVKREQ